MRRRHTERIGDATDIDQRDISFATLDAADVSPVESTAVGNLRSLTMVEPKTQVPRKSCSLEQTGFRTVMGGHRCS